MKGKHTIDLTWSGAAGASVDVYRNGSPLVTTANDVLGILIYFGLTGLLFQAVPV